MSETLYHRDTEGAETRREEVDSNSHAPTTENLLATLRDMASCIVSYLDTEGLRHTVEVDAESLYEAAVLGIRAFKQHDCAPAALNKLEIEIRTSITHEVTVQKVNAWLNGGAKTPKEAVIKQRLRELL